MMMTYCKDCGPNCRSNLLTTCRGRPRWLKPRYQKLVTPIVIMTAITALWLISWEWRRNPHLKTLPYFLGCSRNYLPAPISIQLSLLLPHASPDNYNKHKVTSKFSLMINSLTVILLSPLTNSSGSLKDPLERSSCRLWPRKQPQNNRNSPRHSKLKWLHKSLPSEEALPNKQGKGQQIPGRTEDRCAQYFIISSATSKNIGTAPPATHHERNCNFKKTNVTKLDWTKTPLLH